MSEDGIKLKAQGMVALFEALRTRFLRIALMYFSEMIRFVIWQLFFLKVVIKLSENANDSASELLVSYKSKQRDERQTQEKAIN